MWPLFVSDQDHAGCNEATDTWKPSAGHPGTMRHPALSASHSMLSFSHDAHLTNKNHCVFRLHFICSWQTIMEISGKIIGLGNMWLTQYRLWYYVWSQWLFARWHSFDHFNASGSEKCWWSARGGKSRHERVRGPVVVVSQQHVW